MIAFLRGTVAEKNLKSVILDVHGIGYRVFCSLSTIGEVKEKQEIFLYTHHHIREDDQSLFGFLKTADLIFFEKLISISGIGAKTALDILEVPTQLIAEAIEKSDVNFLKTLKGIGKKTAERMILELRGNLPDLEENSTDSIPSEVIQALSDLGFEKTHIYKVFRELATPLTSSEEMVKWFLQRSA